MKQWIKDFKAFIMRGNVLDMAVGVIIGGAFGSISSSLVNDIIMPAIGLILGKVDFSDLKIVLQQQTLAADGSVLVPEVAIRYGMFIQQVVNFLIIAFAVFVMIRAFNKLTSLHKKPEEPAEPEVPKETAEDILGEIRDLLKEQKA